MKAHTYSVATAFVLLFLTLTFTTASAQITLNKFETVPITLDRVSLPLTDLVKSQPKYVPHPERIEVENESLELKIERTNPHPLPEGEDPALQKYYNSLRDASINVLSVWEGLYDNIDPSDNNIAVGPDHVMQMVNLTYIRIWDKAGNVLVPNLNASSITGAAIIGDPTLIYDAVADRYVFLVIPSFNSKLTVAVSQTNDPTGVYYVYSFMTPNGFPDYPKITMWGNSYFVTTNSTTPTIFALNRDSMLVGAPVGQAQGFALSNFPSLSIQAASAITFTGSMLPDAGEDAMVIRVADDAWGASIDSDHLEYFTMHIDWVDASNSSISGPFELNTIPYNSHLCGFDALASCIRQPGTNNKLETMNSIIMDKAQYRRFADHEVIVCSHVCNADGDGQAGIRWYELRKDIANDWYIYQQGTYSPPDSNGRFMSSISINSEGSIALGYNISSSTVYPGARITGRLWCDTLNIMTAPETEVMTGTHINGSYRYGDYNSVYADLLDDSFWFTAQYNTSNQWSTAVVHFTLTNNCIPTMVNSSVIPSLKLHVVPNPSGSSVNISFMNDKTEDAGLIMIDRIGNVMMEKVLHVNSGMNTAVLDIQLLTDGFYILKIQTLQGVLKEKVIVAH